MIRNLYNQVESTRTTSNITSALTTYNTTYLSGYSVNNYTSSFTSYSTSFNTLKTTLSHGYTWWKTTITTIGDTGSVLTQKVTSQVTYRPTVAPDGLTSRDTFGYTAWETSSTEYNNVTRTTSHNTSFTTTFNTNFNPFWST